MFSIYLRSRHDLCKELVNRLLNKYEYVSIFARQIEGRDIRVTSQMNVIKDTMEKQCGFVCKIYNGKCYSEYSFSDINENNIDELEQKIIKSVQLDSHLLDNHVNYGPMNDEPLVKDFVRPLVGKELSNDEIVARLTKCKDYLVNYNPAIVQVFTIYMEQNVSSMFISRNKDLTQNYFWGNCLCAAVSRNEKNMQQVYKGFGEPSQEKSIEDLENHLEEIGKLALEILDSTMIEPGVYDIITDPSITGLIAHEAFGHGVEMDMYVKNRALSKHYIGKPVASELVDMHDGAGATLSVASYFFDDDGVLAHDTTIIKNGILQTGISDAISAMQLGTEPTGNGRRESTKRKAYTRMTNTFFSPGKDKVEDMIKSIKHGYMLFDTNNGMEDPKNWNIQCTASYGREIKDGKFTGKIVAPVCMSGYVPDLLKSISMVSDEFVVTGAGHCGKGHKEWVCVSDGGPHLKARCKLS